MKRGTTLRQLPVLFELLHGEKTECGRLPFRVRVGVTGHRKLDDEQSVARRVREALDIIETCVLGRSDVTPVRFTAVSALAEGADRLVARVILEREEAQLEVSLPLEPDEFMKDFETEASRAEFQELLACATVVGKPERSEQRPQAYKTGGLRLVDRIDLLIAVWDHEPPRGVGGTAQIVDYAKDQDVPTFIVSTVDPERLDLPVNLAGARSGHRLRRREQTSLKSLRDGFDHLDKFNREPLSRRRFDSALSAERGYVGDAPGKAGYDPSFADWALPFFVRADTFAGYFQWAYTRLALLVFLFAGFAVTAAARQEVYHPDQHKLIWVEVGLMLGVAAIVGLAHWRRHHRRWIDYRSLAENLRSAPYIALLNPDITSGAQFDVRASWVQRAFTEVWAKRPHDPERPTPVTADADALGRFFDTAWVGGQIDFHRKRSYSFESYDRMLNWIIYCFFAGTFLAAVFHATGWVEAQSLVFLAISLPAFGASLSGYRELRQFGIHAERYRRAGERLSQIRTRMLSAEAPERVQAEALTAYGVMLEENLDWFGVLEFQDLQMVV